MSGSEGNKQDSLQEALEITQRYLAAGGLYCSPEKSELISVRSGKERRCSPIALEFADGTPVPTAERVRILGMQIQKDGNSDYTIRQLGESMNQITRMISRVSNRRRGLKEEDLTRIVQALLVSRIMYATPYLNLTLANRKKIDTMIRKAYKAALGLPIYTPTEYTARTRNP
ncbi:hypothetical protein HPB47_017182 [Ixodes persulcatus]|uniref:Uncharacterized protein n=1 Tax=Ixodes persulcatus TaxID=34615 RepID=A0AC60QP80_IXOPE|nr:hypothetical protein HPB47_017182 [Ixodes persulcatus]